MRVGNNFRLAKLLEKPLVLCGVSVERSYLISLTNKATLDHHFRGFPRKVTKTVNLSIQVVRLSVKDCCLNLYTIKLLSFSYISAKFEAAVCFYKVIGAHQR